MKVIMKITQINNFNQSTFDFSKIVDDCGAFDEVLQPVGHVDSHVDGRTVNPDFEDSVKEAETHAEEFDHEDDDEGGEGRVERVQVVLDLLK